MGVGAVGKFGGWWVALGLSAGAAAATGCGSSSANDFGGDDGTDANTGGAQLATDASDIVDATGSGHPEQDGTLSAVDAAAHANAEGGKPGSSQGAGADGSAGSDAAVGDAGHQGTQAADSGQADAAAQAFYGVPLTTTADSFIYEAQVTLGAQTFAMDIDTGSTTVAVAASTCTSCTGITPKYTPTTGVDENATASSMYQDGSGWSGEIFLDTASLEHGTPSVPLHFSTITAQSMFFEANAYQGILGLGSTFNAEPETDSFLALVQARGVAPVTSFELCDSAGTMWLGGYDTAAAGTPVYTPMLPINTTNAFYAINVDDLKIGGVSVGYDAGVDFQEPIVDTGTSLFYVPNRIFTSTLAAINASSGYQAVFGGQQLRNGGCVTAPGASDATVDAQLPSLSLNVPSMTPGGPDSTLTTSATQSYLYDNGNGQFCLAMSNGGTTDASTLGLTFLRAFVTIIDTRSGRVGFAPDTGCAAGGGLRVVHPMSRSWPPKSRPPRVRR